MDESGPPLYDGVNRIDLVEECISSSFGNVLFYDVEGKMITQAINNHRSNLFDG